MLLGQTIKVIKMEEKTEYTDFEKLIGNIGTYGSLGAALMASGPTGVYDAIVSAEGEVAAYIAQNIDEPTVQALYILSETPVGDIVKTAGAFVIVGLVGMLAGSEITYRTIDHFKKKKSTQVDSATA